MAAGARPDRPRHGGTAAHAGRLRSAPGRPRGPRCAAPTRAARPLLAARGGGDRLVLLGDLLELRHGPSRDALAVGAGAADRAWRGAGPGAEVVIVPGNHDHDLLAPWLERRAPARAPGATGPEQRGRPPPGRAAGHGRRAGWAQAAFGPCTRGCGCATTSMPLHGHYADVHLTMPTLERLAAGRHGPDRLAGPRGARAAPRTTRRCSPRSTPGSMRSPSGWNPSAAAICTAARSRGLADARPGPAAAACAGAPGIGYPGGDRGAQPAGPRAAAADLSGAELRRAGLRGMERGAGAARVTAARHVIFGHTHRAGPLPDDPPRVGHRPAARPAQHRLLGPEPVSSARSAAQPLPRRLRRLWRTRARPSWSTCSTIRYR